MALLTHSDENKVWLILAGTIPTIVLATIAVTLRIVARAWSQALFLWDDHTAVASLVVVLGMAATRLIAVDLYSYGYHAAYVGPENLEAFRKVYIGIQSLYFLNATLTKISILFLYNRVFGSSKAFRYAIRASALVVIGYWIPCTCVTLLGCTPFALNWNKSLPGACIDLDSFFRVNGICNTAIDVLILCLPVPMVWRSKSSWQRKLEVIPSFALGLFVCAASILRITSYDPAQTRDLTYAGVESMTWSMIEQGIGIVCACLPVLGTFVRQLYTKWRAFRTQRSIDSFIMCSSSSEGVERMAVINFSRSSSAYTGISAYSTEDGEEMVISPVSPYSPIGAAISTKGRGKTIVVPASAV